jgi:hypothetical protein
MKKLVNKYFIMPLCIGVMCLAVQTATAQSNNIDMPTYIDGATLENFEVTSDKDVYYYSICVKPGTLKIIADLTSEYGGSKVYFSFLNSDFTQLAKNDFEGTQEGNRTVREFKFNKIQKLIIKATFINKTITGKFSFSGALDNACAAYHEELGKKLKVKKKKPKGK